MCGVHRILRGMAQHRYRNRRIFTVERATEEALERLVRAGLYRNASRAVDAAVALLLAQHMRRGEVPPQEHTDGDAEADG